MPILVSFSVTGMPVAKYEMVLRRLEAAGLGAPEGRLHHVSFGDREALQVIDVFANRSALDRFGKQLMPILRELGINADPLIHETYKVIRG